MNGLFSKMRSFVSADKNRYQEGTHDLDLTYITERLIAMSFPAEGLESSYRNNIHDIARFLKEKHGNAYMIFNLCSERGYNYSLFDHQVQGWCGFPDHHAPPLALIFRLCRAIDDWLHKHPKNVAVIHCLDADHQLLTSYGFLGLEELEAAWDAAGGGFCEGLQIATVNMAAGGALEYQSASRLVVNIGPEGGELIEFVGENGLELRVTLEHEMLVELGRCDNGGCFRSRSECVEKVTARALWELGQRDAASAARLWMHVPRGHVAAVADWRTLEPVVALKLESMEQFGEFLRRYGSGMAACKGECEAWVWQLDASLMRIVLEGAAMGRSSGHLPADGRETRVAVESAGMREFLLRAAVHAGWSARVLDEATVALSAGGVAVVALRLLRRVRSSERTFCVTVPNGTIVARRNGSTCSAATVVGNCKAGKGRTGTITSSYLLYCGLFGSATLALNYFAHRRSNNMFGVSSPAQRRYVQYCADVVTNQDLPVTPRVIVQQVILTCMPKLEMGATEAASGDNGELWLEVHTKTREKKTVHRGHVALLYGHDSSKDAVIFTTNCVVQGDVQIDLYVSRMGLLGGKKMQKICFVQFHTTMCGDSTLVFPKSECDKAAFDKRFPANFELCVSVEEVLQSSAPYDAMGEDEIVPNVRAAHSRDGTSPFFAHEYATTELWTRIREIRNFSSPLCEQIEKAGYLCKQGLTVRNWKERWFVLRGGALSYFKSPKNTTPNGTIQLESIYTVALMRDKKVEPGQPHTHSLVLRTELRDFVVCSASVIELEEWAEAIHVATAQLHQQDLMLMPEIGKLFLVILGAENLYCNAIGGEAQMRPLCVASLARQKYTTPPGSGASPQFQHQVLEFNLHTLQSQLQITVWDEQPNLAPRYCGQVSLGVSSLLQHTSPTSIWFPLMKRTTISLVSGSLHVVVYFNANAEPAEQFADKLKRMTNMTTFDNVSHSNLSELLPQNDRGMPRVDSNDFVLVGEENN